MDLKKFLPSREDNEHKEHYWALVIEPGWVQAGIWRIEKEKEKLSYSEERLTKLEERLAQLDL